MKAISISGQPKQHCSINFPSFCVKNSKLPQLHIADILPIETTTVIPILSGKIISNSAIKRWLTLEMFSVGLVVLKVFNLDNCFYTKSITLQYTKNSVPC